jgi:hypothetical protein
MSNSLSSGAFHWVVQRNAGTGELITFLSFSDCADALRHKAELHMCGDPLDRVSVLAIESLPVGEVPRSRIDWKRDAFS